jgi:RHS repeat-associated protein
MNSLAIKHIEIDRSEIRESPLKLQEGRDQYLPFGELLLEQRRADWGTVYKYNGKELDCESGYYYYVSELVEDIEMSSERAQRSTGPAVPSTRNEERMRSRYYNPGLGRFLSVDPLADYYPDQSPYLYAYNNPIRFIDVDGLYGDEGEANKQRDAAISKGLKVSDIYQSGDEWGFNVINGEDSYSDFGLKSSFGKEGASNQSGGGFWSWFSSLFRPGSAKDGSSDGIEGLGNGGSLNTPDGSADRIIDYTEFPVPSLGGGMPGLQGALKKGNAFGNISISTAQIWHASVAIPMELDHRINARNEFLQRNENVVDTQDIIDDNGIIVRYRVRHFYNEKRPTSHSLRATPFDTLKTNK